MAQSSRRTSAPGLAGIVRDGVLELRVEGMAAQVALGAGVVLSITLLGWGLRLFSPGVLPVALLFPAILIASLIGGWRAGLTAGVLSLLARTVPLRPQGGFAFETGASALVNFGLFALATAAIVAMGAYAAHMLADLRRSRDALAERSLHYATLFETVPEGFAICDAIRDESGRLIDYTIVEINPALLKLLGVGSEVVGARLTESPGDWTRWLQLCQSVLDTGEPLTFERQNRANKLWHEVHLSRLTQSRMAQFFFDITERKASEARQAGLFDELNHRVKNNLAMVASLLQLQARGSREEVRSELIKAAARVQSIAAVHGALSRETEADQVDFGAYLTDLCVSLKRSLAVENGVDLEVEAETASLPVDTAIPLGMVVNELVTNSVKYAYPRGTSGPIEVGFRRDGNAILLTVRDEGKGLPSAIEVGGGGLGMRLVRSLVEQVGGELSVRDGEGAWFEIRLPAEGRPTPPGEGGR